MFQDDYRNNIKRAIYSTTSMNNTKLPSTTGQSKPMTAVEALLVSPPVTPNSTSMAAYQVLSEIEEIHSKLNKLSSLAPSHQINSLLTRLVTLCVVPYSAEFTTCFFRISGVEQLCDRLRPICSEAESELEKYHAERMLKELGKSFFFPDSHTHTHTPKCSG
jgi:nicotianamine synthase